ncbi:MAG: hypothetical protein Q4D16_14130 [Eubacteriales bacterium]|nr:hypothetical protein [Eubacteriales bacterium]
MRKLIMLLGLYGFACTFFTHNIYAQTYEKTSESGKVRFQCELEVPEEINEKNTAPKILLESVNFGDSAKAYANFVEGQDIVNQYNDPANDLYPEENAYVFADGTHVNIGRGIGISTDNFTYYGQIGATNPENMERYVSAANSSVDEQAAVQKVKEALEQAGYMTETLDFKTYPLSAEVSEEIENQLVQEGLLENDKRKNEWTKEDDACVVYARQVVSGIPVYPELSVMAQQLAYDTPDSCPVVAIYSTRGIESLRVYGLYNFKETGESVTLKSFDEIAATVEMKYENLLDEAVYTVNRAKFYERVYINEAQQYVAEPIWYLELTSDTSNQYVMLVNAETGKEIYLM